MRLAEFSTGAEPENLDSSRTRPTGLAIGSRHAPRAVACLRVAADSAWMEVNAIAPASPCGAVHGTNRSHGFHGSADRAPGLVTAHGACLLLHRPGLAAVEQGLQVARAALLAGLFDLLGHQFFVARGVDRTEDADRLRELGVAHAAEQVGQR